MADVIATPNAPSAIGPYAQARASGNFIFVSGQSGLTPEGVLPAGFETQAHNTLKNLSSILEAAGSSLAKVVKTTVFLRDMENFQAFNAIYSEYFKIFTRKPQEEMVMADVIATPNAACPWTLWWKSKPSPNASLYRSIKITTTSLKKGLFFIPEHCVEPPPCI